MSSTDTCREPSCGGILHTSNWEETQGQTQNTHLVWEHLLIPQEELEDVAREKDVSATLLCRQKMDTWMDTIYSIEYS